MDPDFVNSIGKVWVVFWTGLGAASVFFPYGTSLTGNVLTSPVWLYVVEAVFFGVFALGLFWSFFDRVFREQHVSQYTRHPARKLPIGTRLFVPYTCIVGMLCAAVGFYMHLSWSLRNPGIDTLADFMAAAGGYVSEGYAAACAVSVAMRVTTAVTFLVMLFADAGQRASADLLRMHIEVHHGIKIPV